MQSGLWLSVRHTFPGGCSMPVGEGLRVGGRGQNKKWGVGGRGTRQHMGREGGVVGTSPPSQHPSLVPLSEASSFPDQRLLLHGHKRHTFQVRGLDLIWGGGEGTMWGPTAQVGLSGLGQDSLISGWQFCDNRKRPRSALGKTEIYTRFAVWIGVQCGPGCRARS